MRITAKSDRKSEWEATAANGRFCEMTAVTPQTILCEIARLYPAASSVKPPPRKAAGALPASSGQRSGKTKARPVKPLEQEEKLKK